MVDMQRYGKAQRFAFVGVVLGFIITFGAGCAPFWKEGKITVNDLTKIIGENIPFIGELSILEFHGGLFIYCIDAVDGSRECEVYDQSHGNAADNIAVVSYGISLILSLVCACAACCRVCCCTGGRTICHGVMAFLAGGFGCLTVILFASNSEKSWDMKLDLVHYNWAFIVFIVGVSLTLLSSFALCCAYPESPIVAMLPGRLTNGGVSVMVSHQSNLSYNQLHEENHMQALPPNGYLQQPQPSFQPLGPYPQAAGGVV